MHHASVHGRRRRRRVFLGAIAAAKNRVRVIVAWCELRAGYRRRRG
jgi:hypothetical protein